MCNQMVHSTGVAAMTCVTMVHVVVCRRHQEEQVVQSIFALPAELEQVVAALAAEEGNREAAEEV